MHLYAGLVLLPWILFFGASGVLFNHPNLGEQVSAFRVGPERIREVTGLTGWKPDALAAEVVRALNVRAGKPAYSLDPELPSRLNGMLVLKANAAEGKHIVLYEPERSFAIVATRFGRPQGDDAPFATDDLALPEYTLPALEGKLQGLLAAQGLTAQGPLHGDPRMAPTLELRLKDESGQRWNVSYSVGKGALTARRSEQWPNIGLSQLFTTLHTTHHFPIGLKARWFWALFQDLLGIAMVFWGLSGMVMWWQLKVTRIAGLASLLAALGIAGAVAFGTASELFFGDVAQQLGPGE